MCRRLLEVVAASVGTFSAAEGCGCELDEACFPESFKGNHMRGSFELPGRAHRRGRIQDGAAVAADRSGACPSALRGLSAAAHHAYDSRNRSEGTISHVNALRSALDGFMARCRGVSARHLAEHLAWFRWDCPFSVPPLGAGAPVRQMEPCVCHASPGDCRGAEPPCMECWARQVAWHAM